MEQQNNSDKTTFKVKFLGEYHDMVIDWNDDKYEPKQRQVFKQLASLTGIPVKYERRLGLVEARPVDPEPLIDGQRPLLFLEYDNDTHLPYANPNNSTFVKDKIHDKCIENGERFHLKFYPFYDFFFIERIGIEYELIPETMVQEGVCSYIFCQHKNSKSYFKKVKDLVCNDDLNSQISQRVQTIRERAYNHGGHNSAWLETDKVFREYNVQQFLRNECHLYHRPIFENEEDNRQMDLYLRMRG